MDSTYAMRPKGDVWVMTPMDVINSRIPLPTTEEIERSDRQRGIYLLMSGDDVVYVGQTEDVYVRLHQHMKQGRKVFDSWVFVPIEEDDHADLDPLECGYMVMYTPKYNKRLPNNAHMGDLTRLVRRFGLKRVQLKKIISRHRVHSINGYYHLSQVKEAIDEDGGR